LIVRCGGPPTSKAFTEWLARNATADLWLVDPAGGFQDPQHRATRTCRIDPRQFCELTASAIGKTAARATSWRDLWERADRVARSAATAAIAAEPKFLMPHVATALWSQLADDCTLYAANSMAIREVDTFAGPRAAPLRVLANRGVNGIDGLVSCALGAATALGKPTVLWCGDLALLHDVGGLLAGTLQNADLTIVVGNDDGGGIFEYLPAAQLLPRAMFERVFAVPHGQDLCQLARGLGWQATRVESTAGFGVALADALRGGRHLLEVPVNRAANTAFHRSLHAAVGAELDREFAA
jgi:2-succinyl-5-enolpyruvyl-6-hydroxy-3-cyclohexene-1-carboxylate synthase